ncbi:MAG: hydroxyacid dehydrogenase [Anaerolineaceae bacterium]|nr:hydroxyacid dehydrogenase [Anaerolineaceae bacterium]
MASTPKTTGIMILDLKNLEKVYPPSLRNQLENHVHFMSPPLNRQMVLDQPEILQEVEVIFSSWGMVKLDAELLEFAPNLKAVFYGAGSIRYFTSSAFWKRGIKVSSAYHINGEFVANFTLAQILLSLKRYWHYLHQYKINHQTWLRDPIPGMYKSKVGIISLGAIGRKVIELLKPFDLEVWAYDPYYQQTQADEFGVKLCSLETIFQQCNIVSLHTPWLPETEGLITGGHISSMKQGATFINTARGAVVREKEMVQALEQRPDLTALLDVTYPEPPSENSKLFALPNIILSPHIAGAMDGEIEKMGALMVSEFLRWKNEEVMQFEINEENAKTLA